LALNLEQKKAIVAEVTATAPREQSKVELDAMLELLRQFDQNVILTLQQPMAGVSADAFSKTIMRCSWPWVGWHMTGSPGITC